jgi:membrane-anchored glycerophosphoryl diester phosphodiesterase (GDPDase)
LAHARLVGSQLKKRKKEEYWFLLAFFFVTLPLSLLATNKQYGTKKLLLPHFLYAFVIDIGSSSTSSGSILVL